MTPNPIELEAGQGIVDITPPLGIELGGFFVPQGKGRVISEIRMPSSARALVLRHGSMQVALVSLDILNLSRPFCEKARRQVEDRTGIPAVNVRISATHSHSTPAICPVRRCGLVSTDYVAEVGRGVVRAVEQAQQDASPARLRVGSSRVKDGNYNRTTKHWKTDAQFDATATDDERWLDTMLHVLHFERASGKRDLLWYQFSAHPACNNDNIAWPNWPGLVVQLVEDCVGLSPSFWQGHCGDVHPGPGEPRLGDPEKVAEVVAAAVEAALDKSEPMTVDAIRTERASLEVPLDFGLLQKQLRHYHDSPETCNGDGWLDADFAANWAQSAERWDPTRTSLATSISAIGLGNVGLLFHGSELFSYYGLAIRRGSPFAQTLVVGHTDDCIGYLADPKAYALEEYAATLAPMVLDRPPFRPNAARLLAARSIELLGQLAR